MAYYTSSKHTTFLTEDLLMCEFYYTFTRTASEYI